MHAHLLLERHFGHATMHGEEVSVIWITARVTDYVTIPGGVIARGWVPVWQRGDVPSVAQFAHFTHSSPSEEAWELFCQELARAYKKIEDEDAASDDNCDADALTFFKPFVSSPGDPWHWGRRVIFVHSYRESEAAQVVFDCGIRTKKDKSGKKWQWPALGKLLQEKPRF